MHQNCAKCGFYPLFFISVDSKGVLSGIITLMQGSHERYSSRLKLRERDMVDTQPGFWAELILFIKVYLSNWQSYATGGIVTGLISAGERLSGKNLSKKAYFLIFVVSFSLAAFFLAWRDEFTSAGKLSSTTSQLTGENRILKQENETLTNKLADKERPIIVQAAPAPEIEKLLRRQDEELAKLKNSLPSPKKRAL